jgi:predicted DNA-binding transcriptional regulator AlpA
MTGAELAEEADKGQARLQRYLTTNEVAAILRTSPETVRWWRHIGSGPKSFKIGRRVLYAAADVEAFIAEARAD